MPYSPPTHHPPQICKVIGIELVSGGCSGRVGPITPKEIVDCVLDHVKNRAHQSMYSEDLPSSARRVLMALQGGGSGVLRGSCLLDGPTTSAHVGVTMIPELSPLPPNYIMMHTSPPECLAKSQHPQRNSCSFYDRQRHPQENKPILPKEMRAQRMVLMFKIPNPTRCKIKTGIPHLAGPP